MGKIVNSNQIDKRFNYGICDVAENYNFYFQYLLSKLHSMFVWHNLPETIDVDSLNNQLFLNGMTCFTKFNDKLYCLEGNVGGKPNEYYYPTTFTIANPILGSKQATILGDNQDSVMMYNSRTDKQTMWLPSGGGLFQLIKQTATLLADNIVSISTAQINSRIQAVFTAESQAQANTAEMIIKDLYAGKPYRTVPGDELEKFTVQGINNTAMPNIIAQLVELQQFIIGQFYQNIGIKFNSTNKKERLITDEINFQDDFLAVNLYTMLESRKEAVEKINELFGTDISVELSEILQPVIEDAVQKTEDKEDETPEESNQDNNSDENVQEDSEDKETEKEGDSDEED